ncbi:MAG: aldehyde dehydrogenase family protein, partial [Actinobacteria bacterium]|nr:aldehyde dehydrogenase family protein [Actinomycetota bacterium]
MTNRIEVLKTYKLYINGQFPRSESGRVYEIKVGKDFIANPAQASRKDLRDAVTAARGAQSGWAGATAYNRGQILYRIAEMLEGRTSQFVEEISLLEKTTTAQAKAQVAQSIDRWVWYAGWADKIATTFGVTNPVAGPYYNFTVPEPMGVVGILAPEKPSLLGLVDCLAPVLVSGNTAILVASHSAPLTAITFAEVLATSDLPAGVCNILTGIKDELAPWMASHMDINAMDISGAAKKNHTALREAGADNLKRI